MGFICQPGEPDPVTALAVMQRVAERALSINDRLLAENAELKRKQKPARRKAAS